LTLVECDRVLVRAQSQARLTATEATDRRTLLEVAAATWYRLQPDRAILERARQPFPAEPLRTLDALHLASALRFRDAVPDLRLLSLDRRIRGNGVRLGLLLAPPDADGGGLGSSQAGRP
jgi:hypothetical protein